MRTRRACRASLALAGVLFATLAAGSAHAADPDYQGTYAGTVTTSSGRQVPITVYAFDAGDEAELTLAAEGYHVVVPATESWVGEELVLSPTVPGIYSAVLSGNGTVTFVPEGDVWRASGGGTGTALDRYSGSAEGSVERVATTMDPDAAAAWHIANPVEGGEPPETERAGAVKALEGLSAVGAPPLQAPLGDPEKLLALAVIGLWAGIMVVMAAVFFGPRFPAELAFFELGTMTNAEVERAQAGAATASQADAGEGGGEQ